MKAKFLVGTIVLGACLLTGCGNKPISDSNSNEIATSNFKVKIYNSYTKADNTDSDRISFVDGNKVIYVYETTAMNSSFDANVEFYKNLINESYDSISNLNVEDITADSGVEYSIVSYDTVVSGNKAYGQFDITYSEGSVIMISGSCEKKYAESLKYDLDQMISTVVYTGDYTIPTDYPFVVENDSFKVTVPEGFNATTNTYDETITYTYMANENYNVGSATKLKIAIEEDVKESISKAEENYTSKDLFTNMKKEETELGKIFTSATGDLASVKATYFTADVTTIDGYIEACFFEYNGKGYSISTLIPSDDTAKNDMHAVQFEIKR